MSLPSHGSSPNYIYDTLRLTIPDKLIDLSVNLNSFELPKGIKQNRSSWLQTMVARHTSNYPSLNERWLRFVIRNKKENALLLEALSEWN